MLRTLLLALSLTIPPAYAGECNCIVIPDATGKHQIKCDVPSIIVFTNTIPTVTPALTSVPFQPPVVPQPPIVKPIIPTPKPNIWDNPTIGIDPKTGGYIFK